jgi:hypothetical protein
MTITREDLTAGQWRLQFHADSDDRGRVGSWHFESSVSPRFTKVETSRGAKTFYVDGWRCDDASEILERLNGPQKNPPKFTPPRQLLQERAEKLAQDPALDDPAVLAAELERENGERLKLYTKLVEQGARLDKYARWYAITLRWARKARAARSMSDLFGG